MKGTIITRTLAGGKTKCYDVRWRVDGRQKSQTFARRKAAETFLADVVTKVHAGTYRELQSITFAAYAEKWRAGLGGGIKPSTAASYRSILEHQLIPAFGPRQLASLTVDDVNIYLAAREGTLKPKTLRNHLVLLGKLFGDAMESGYLAINRLAKSKALRRPRALRPEDDAEVEILDAAEVNQLLDQVSPHYLSLYITAVSTGMRLGELLAFQWGDVAWSTRQLRVRRSLYKGQCFLPKSKKSRRAIDVGDQVLGALRALERARYGEAGAPPDAHVFLRPDGTLIDPDNLRNRVWEPAVKAAGLRHVTQHSLRHTYASLLIAQGENPKYISEQLGHASIQITMDRYGHLFPNQKRTTAARLEAQLAAGKEQAPAAEPSNTHPTEQAEPGRNTREQAGGRRAGEA
jgi:integrase